MNVESFRAAFNDLARPNRFQVILQRAGNMQFFCKATDVPAQTVDAMDANYQGRIIKLPGDRTNPDWTVTVYGAIDYVIYNNIQAWLSEINDPAGNVGAVPGDIIEDAVVNQLDRQDNIIASWTLINVFPTEIGQITLDWSTNSSPMEFTANFAMDYLVPNGRGGVANS